MSGDAEIRVTREAWAALGALVVGFFMILVDSTIVSVALPALMDAFDASITNVAWVTSAYLLAYAVPLLTMGRLGDRIGPKRIYMAGLTLFTLASLACALAPSLGALVGARIAQGIAASMMTPQTMAVITRTFPRERRGGAMAIWGATAGVATLAGPIIGGLLIDAASWEWIFLINLPVGLVGLYLAWRLVPRLETTSRSFDWLGVALSALGIFALVFAIQEGEAFNWGTIWGPISVSGLAMAGAALLGAFIVWQMLNRREPLVPLALFRDRNFSVSNVAIAAVGFAVTAMMFPFMLYTQLVRGFTPTQAALLLAPQAVMSILLAPIAGRLVDRHHPRLLTGFGIAGFLIALLLLSRVMGADTPVWQVLAVTTLMGTAQSFVWGPLATSANRNLPLNWAGAGSGVYNTTRQMGAVLGSASIAALMQMRITAHLRGADAATGPAGGPDHTAAAEVPMPTFGDVLEPELAEPFAAAFSEAMLLPAALVALGLVAALFFENSRHLQARRTPGAPAAPPGR
ncbi:MAG: DHA2 family efflux MFS transporter permease subunit [bacterium]|nr:DHA2 family efflux MFS transporter permease subunit [bacterium]